MYSPDIVCFCDIPEPDLDIHMAKYSRFGIALSKSFLVESGAAPVFYIPRGAIDAFGETKCKYFDNSVRAYHELFNQLARLTASSFDRELRLNVTNVQRFLDYAVFSYMKFFDENLPDDHTQNYYMEREWRLLGHVEFKLTDVVRVIVPRTFSDSFRERVPNYNSELKLVDG